MNHEKPLTILYKQYNSNGITKKELEGKIFQYLLGNLNRYSLFDRNRERWEDFLSWLYPRLVRAIDQYHDCGSSFDAYISAIVNGASKEYRHRETDHYITEYVCWQAKAEEMRLYESEPEYPGDKSEFRVPNNVNPRQILILLLKSYYFVTDEMIEKAAQAAGKDPEEIKKMIREIKKQRSGKDEEILALRERIHCQHYRYLAYLKRMQFAYKGTDYHERMKIRFEQARKRYLAMKKRLNGMRMTASNKIVAEVLGIPLGTVDTTLSAIKNRTPQSSNKAV